MDRLELGGSSIAFQLVGEETARGTVAFLNGIAMSMSHWKPVTAALVASGYRVMLPWTYSARWLEENEPAVLAREAVVASLPHDWFRAFAALCDSFLAIDLKKDLGKIRVPTLVIAAEHDILKGARFSKTMVEGIAGARYEIIANAGHAAVVERPAEVSRLVLEFLEDAALKRS